MPNGVTYYGNELAAENGAFGGAFYKFVRVACCCMDAGLLIMNWSGAAVRVR